MLLDPSEEAFPFHKMRMTIPTFHLIRKSANIEFVTGLYNKVITIDIIIVIIIILINHTGPNMYSLSLIGFPCPSLFPSYPSCLGVGSFRIALSIANHEGGQQPKKRRELKKKKKSLCFRPIYDETCLDP